MRMQKRLFHAVPIYHLYTASMPLEHEEGCRLWIGFYVNHLPKSCVAEWWFVHVVEIVDLGMSETEMRLVERMTHEHLVQTS